jgi:hypothetical protein
MNDAVFALESARVDIKNLIASARTLPTITEQQRRDSLRDYHIISRNISNALSTRRRYDMMRALWYSLELAHGMVALSKGPRAYKAFQRKWNDPKYNVFKS